MHSEHDLEANTTTTVGYPDGNSLDSQVAALHQSTYQQVEELKAALAAKDQELLAAKNQLQAMRQGPSSRQYTTPKTKPTWEFRVEPFRKDLPQVTPLQDFFVDESEALRCFWIVNSGKKGVNKNGEQYEIDPANTNVVVTCMRAVERDAQIRAAYLPKIPAALVPLL